MARSHDYAKPHEVLPRGLAQGLRERREYRGTRLDEEDPRRARVEMPEVPCERQSRDLRQRAGELDAGRPAADHDERQQRFPALRVRLTLRPFEGHQHAPADVERVFERLEAGRVRRHSS